MPSVSETNTKQGFRTLRPAARVTHRDNLGGSMAKSVLISGGSRGIGRAVAIQMARDGWNVAFTYVSDAGAAGETLAGIEGAGAKALAVQGDTAVEADVMRAFDETIGAFGGLDAVIVNAGVVASAQPVAEMDVARMRRVFDTNVLGAFLFAREAARRLPGSRSGDEAAIVLVSSIAARLGSPFEYVDYAASKGAVDTLVVGLAKELAGQGIRVNGVRPGIIDTDIHASGGQPDRVKRLGQTVPLGRAGAAEEVARAIVFLASDAASYSTGSIMDVSGGR